MSMLAARRLRLLGLSSLDLADSRPRLENSQAETGLMNSTQKPPPAPSSLCFLQAYEQYAAKKISWEEYLHHGLLHYVNGFVAHEGEYLIDKNELHGKDPFTFALWRFQLPRAHRQDVSQLEAVFQAYGNGSVEDLDAKLEPLHPLTGKSMRKLVALLSLRDKKLEMLQYILNDSQEYYDPSPFHTFTDMVNSVDESYEPELYRIIQQSEWKRLETQQAQHAAKLKAAGIECGAPPGAEKAFDFW